ncbi:MAG: hypothetical protein ABIJ45_03515 [Candidatus Zixiibacteriota bacterium]
MSEEFLFSIRFSIIGTIIVFTALTIIALTIYYVSKAEKYFADKAEVLEDFPADQKSNIDNTTLVLISAAVATMLQGRYYIKRVRRLLPGNHINSPWASQGLAILHGSHVIKKQ